MLIQRKDSSFVYLNSLIKIISSFLKLFLILASLQSSLQQYEEKNSKIKQLLVKTKKELADSKQAETDHLMLQASLKGELEASQQQVEVYKVRFFLLFTI